MEVLLWFIPTYNWGSPSCSSKQFLTPSNYSYIPYKPQLTKLLASTSLTTRPLPAGCPFQIFGLFSGRLPSTHKPSSRGHRNIPPLWNMNGIWIEHGYRYHNNLQDLMIWYGFLSHEGSPSHHGLKNPSHSLILG